LMDLLRVRLLVTGSGEMAPEKFELIRQLLSVQCTGAGEAK